MADQAYGAPEIGTLARYGPRTAAALQRSQYLAAVLNEAQQQGQTIKGGLGELAARLVGQALMARAYNKANQGLQPAITADQQEAEAPIQAAWNLLPGGSNAPQAPAVQQQPPPALDATQAAPPVPQVPQASAPAPPTSRASRNNNPLNLTSLPHGAWDGQVGNDGPFAVFSSPQAGLAAADRNLQSYQRLHGINTIGGVINRWAPQSGGNDTGGYIGAVSQDLGVAPNQPIDLTDPQVRQKLLMSMAKVESGGTPVGVQQIADSGQGAPLPPQQPQQPPVTPQAPPGLPQPPPQPGPAPAASAGPPGGIPSGYGPTPQQRALVASMVGSTNYAVHQQGLALQQKLIEQYSAAPEYEQHVDPGTGQVIWAPKDPRAGTPYAQNVPGYRAPAGPGMTYDTSPAAVKPIPGTIPPQVLQMRENLTGGDVYKLAQESLKSFNAMSSLASQQPGGMRAYALRDTFARTINPGAVARANTIQAIRESQGIPENIKSFFLNLQSDGDVSPEMVQQIIGSARPFAQANLDAYNRAAESNRGLAKFYQVAPEEIAPDIGQMPAAPVIPGLPASDPHYQRKIDWLGQHGWTPEQATTILQYEGKPNSPPAPRTPAQFAAIPKGAQFIDGDGKVKTKQ
jgi:hypothetical protein